jgi:hypothetical protein
MIRSTLLSALLAAGLVLAPAALAETSVQAAMPVIAAAVEGDAVTMHLARTVSGRTRSSMFRTVTVEGFDASGASLGVTSAEIPRRATFATIALAANLRGAARLVTTAR